MNDSPGWAAPGTPSDDRGSDDRPADGEGADRPSAGPTDDSKWSADQPPPGQWSSPTPGQTPPQQPQQPQQQGWGTPPGTPYAGAPTAPYAGSQGPYGHPGGAGQWGRPPAAKPGVIPLRPLGLGEILDGAMATMRAHWRSVLPITLVVATVIQVIGVLLQKYVFADLSTTTTSGAKPRLDDVVNDLGSTLAFEVATGFIQLLGTIVATAMLTMIFSRAVLGHSSTVSAAWRDARPQLPRLIGLTLIMGVGAVLLGGVLMLPGILAGSTGLVILGIVIAFPLLIWLGIKFTLASAALMLEKCTVRKAFGRSSKLVQGSWWRVFGISLLTGLIAGVVAAIITWPMTILGLILFGGGMNGLQSGTAATAWGVLVLSGVGVIIAQTVTLPLQSGVTVLLYVDQRIRREALDLELARAAGVEHSGTTGG
ncbi:glycerophosphoryl diester phosphodiesterase membrane domain-containing protein [Streptomyces sp. NPDC088097]|uniref:glycerophosphoryl diester phosphodiesterase membrane domain-containing protein n=1 Tax=Streptomyces sp. NPDC088097 TaxID=3365823 RepID=UPI0038236F71